jgi:hypothetical protein
MQKLHIVALGLLTIVLGIGGFAASHSEAAPTPKVYGLYDANNTYLGDVVGITYGSASAPGSGLTNGISYTTYLPSLDVLVPFVKSNGSLHVGGYPESIYYDGVDCTGSAYINTDDGAVPWTAPWIVRALGITYKVDAPIVNPELVSTYNYNTCVNSAGSGAGIVALIPVTLPFDPTTVALPFNVK